MTTQTLIFKSTFVSGPRARQFLSQALKWIRHIMPRPCMIVSVGLLLAGLSIPFLMGLTLIPASFIVGFLGMAFTCMGGVLTLYYL